jgi:uncharacterized protein (TIGR00369 family)
MQQEVPPEHWKDSFGYRLGIHYEAVEPGHVVASLEILPEHCNPSGVCHGGVIFSLADDTMGAALFPLSPEGHLPTSAQVNIHYSRSARPGDRLRVEARVLTHGRRTAVVEARVTDARGRLVSLLTASCLFVEARHVGEAQGET